MQYIRYPAATGATPAEIEAAIVAALDAVFPTNISGTPLYHDASANNINGTFSEVAASATIPANTKALQISSIIGKPLQIGIGANSGAAVAKIDLVAGGGPLTIPIQYATNDKLFVRTLDASTVSTNYFVVNFLGA